MTAHPTRTTTAGRTYLDLQNRARRAGRPTDELHQIYALEGFLDRLARSTLRDKFVIKGGVLLAAYDTRRPTRDVDLQGRSMSNEINHIGELVCDIAAYEVDDGLVFDARHAQMESIRDGDIYSGVRVSLSVSLAPARLSLHVDVNVGDPILPAPTVVAIPRLLDGYIELAGYPLCMVFAEKIVTAIHRGSVNTRWRDYADIFLLSRRHEVDGSSLTTALSSVASHRQVPLVSLQGVLHGYAVSAQSRWATWVRKNRLDDRLPSDFGQVLHGVISFSDPVLAGDAVGKKWLAVDGVWLDT